LQHALTKILPYSVDQMVALVGDVQAYPDFIPWITQMRTWNALTREPGVTQLDAEAAVGFKFLSERFATRVLCDLNQARVEVALLYGPFRKLSNIWAFYPDPAGTRIEFSIDFEFKTRLLDALLKANMNSAVERLIGCFEERAKWLYGPQTP
jgi:coenzyme Q-binding protein COQ10